jgi:hypothetical protein
MKAAKAFPKSETYWIILTFARGRCDFYQTLEDPRNPGKDLVVDEEELMREFVEKKPI